MAQLTEGFTQLGAAPKDGLKPASPVVLSQLLAVLPTISSSDFEQLLSKMGFLMGC